MQRCVHARNNKLMIAPDATGCARTLRKIQNSNVVSQRPTQVSSTRASGMVQNELLLSSLWSNPPDPKDSTATIITNLSQD